MWIKRELTQPVSHVILFSSAGAFKARSGAEWAKQLLPPHRSECLSSLQPHAWRPPGPLHRYTLYGYFWIIYIFILLVSVQSQTHFIVFNGYLTEISFMAITLIIYSVILYRDSISMSHPLWHSFFLSTGASSSPTWVHKQWVLKNAASSRPAQHEHRTSSFDRERPDICIWGWFSKK